MPKDAYVPRRAINFNMLVAAAHITTLWAINLPPKKVEALHFKLIHFKIGLCTFIRKRNSLSFFYETGKAHF